jgi:NAD(P)-dependent dehydrogenase (short-subunit alcohol dehydrogenase family)
MHKLQGKRALVTAGAQGIGLAISRQLLAAGCDLFVHYRSSVAAARALEPEAKTLGRQYAHSAADLTNPEECDRLVREAVGFLGGLDVLVNNAGSLVARKLLAERNVAARVVSMPCFELFQNVPEEQRRAMIGDAPVKIGVEAAVRQGWDAIIGSDGVFVGMSTFGASAPYKDLYKQFGITPEKVAEAALKRLGKN